MEGECVLLHHFMGACICTHQMIQHVPKFIFCPNTNMNPTDMMQCPALDTFWIWADGTAAVERGAREEGEERKPENNGEIETNKRL